MTNPEHLTTEAVNRYRERKSSAAELLAVQAHVSDCPTCRAELEHAIDANAAILSLRGQMTGGDFNLADEPLHLPYEQLALYIDNQLNEVEREIADSHLSLCEECAGDLADLHRYQIIASAESEPESATAAWPEQSKALEKTGTSWWQRLLAFDFFPRGGALVPAGITAAIIAVLLLGIWLATHTASKNEVVRVETPNQNISVPTPVSPAPTPSIQSSPSNNIAPAQNQNSSGQQNNRTPLPSSSPRTPQGNSRSTSANEAQTLALNDGGERVTLFDSEGNFTGLESQPSSVRDAVRRSVEAQRAQTPRGLDAIAEGSTGVLMSGSAEATNNGVPFALVAPVGKVLRESQPTLSWQPLAGAKSYTVAIVDARFRIVTQSQALTDTQWTPAQALPRGANYSWQVTAMRADGTKVISPVSPAPQARFRVMEQTALEEVTRMESSGVRSHLARGVIYAEAGLLDEARVEFTELVRDNPRSKLARNLLKSVSK